MNKERINTLLFAFIIFSQTIIYTLSNIFGIDGFLSFYILAITIIAFLINNFKVQKDYILYFIFLIIIFLKDFLTGINDYKINYFILFLANSIPIIYIFINIKRNPFNSTVYKMAVFWSFLYIIINFINKDIFDIHFDNMSFGYSLTPIFFVVYLHNLQNKKTFSTIYLILLFFLIIIFGNRGAILSILIFLFFQSKNKLKTIIFYSFFFILIISFGDVIYDFLFREYDIHASLIYKMSLFKQDIDSFLNGRFQLYDDLYYGNPLFGNGIGYYEYVNSGVYVHNYIFQIFIEYGLVGVLIILIITLKIIKDIIFKNNIMEKYIYVFLFSLSIPRLIFSSTIYNNMFFWLLLFLIFRNLINRKKEVF